MIVDLTLDGFSAQTKLSVKWFYDQVGTTLKILERATPWANLSEIHIGLLKEAARKGMIESTSPIFLWFFELDCRALTHNAVTCTLFQAQGKTS